MKICVYAIAKNEEKFVERFCEAAKDADLILIADTGSMDETVEKAIIWGDERGPLFGAGPSVFCPSIFISPWRFDHARNAALALIPSDIDVCVSLDLDEVLQPGWRAEIERVWELGKTTRLRYMFDWGVGIAFKYEKIHARKGYRWHHPCHEYPMPDCRIKEVWADTDMLLVVHKPDPTKSRGQYLDLLKVSVTEDPFCPRNAFYYARELSFARKWNESIAECRRYLALPRADWPNERCYAYRVMGWCYSELNEPKQAEKAFHLAAMEAPGTREPWCELAMLCYRQSRWAECLAYASRALAIEKREWVYTVDPAVWKSQPHDLAAIAAWNLGMREYAIEQACLAVEKEPDDPRLRRNYEMMRPPAPNIVHFVWFTGPQSRRFGFLNHLAIKAAAEVQKPDAIFMYCNEEPKNNMYWEMIRSFVNIVHVDEPNFKGVKWGNYPHYWSDLVRLQELEKIGGIYLDTDAILLKPLNEFLVHDCVLAGGIPPDVFRNKNPCVSAATIIARPHAPFIKHWLEGFADAIGREVWSGAMTDFPLELHAKHPGELTLIPLGKFLPFDWTNDSVLDPTRRGEYDALVKDSYVAHMWDTMWSGQLATMPHIYLESLFGGDHVGERSTGAVSVGTA